jgi:hypothetical protein
VATLGRPTRRMDESCLSKSSEISEKLFFLDFIPLSFFTARSARAPILAQAGLRPQFAVKVMIVVQ